MEILGNKIDLGTIITTAAFLLAIFEYYQKTKLNRVIKAITKSFPGDLALINQHCKWANVHVREAAKELNKISDCEAKQKLNEFLTLASGNTMAGREVSRTVFSNLLTFQSAQFGTREIESTGSDELELCILENKQQQQRTAK